MADGVSVFVTERELTGMRFVIMHKTDARWEDGAIPGPELMLRVGTLLGELAAAGTLAAAEGLRPSSEGVRLRFSGNTPVVVRGPFASETDVPAGFTILRAASIDEAIAWATRQAAVLGDAEVDIRPVVEPWDVGIGSPPADLTHRRYMVLRKATAATEGGVPLSPVQRTELSRLIEETTAAGVHLVSETMRPSARGRRYKNSRNGISVFDGPFIESKELIGGYIIVSLESLVDADRCAMRYLIAVETDEVDVRELE